MQVLDTNILVYYSKDEKAITDYIARAFRDRTPLVIPTAVVVEYLSFPLVSDGDRAWFRGVLDQCYVVDLNLDTAFVAAQLRSQYKMSFGDCVIAATAVVLRAPLVTRNVKDFQEVRGLEVIKL